MTGGTPIYHQKGYPVHPLVDVHVLILAWSFFGVSIQPNFVPPEKPEPRSIVD